MSTKTKIVIYHKCDLCDDYETKYAGNLKRHKADKHNIGVTLYKCDLCDYEAKQPSHLKTHKAYKHNIGVTLYKCDLCDYDAKRPSNLKRHKADKHNIGVTWYKCDLCDHKTKNASDLKKHKASKHNIGVTLYKCDLCDYEAKRPGHLKSHKERIHDIGPHRCDYCFGNRHSRITYKDKNLGKNVHICRKCFNKATGKTSRVEVTWSNHLDKNLGTDFLLSSDRSMRSLGGCSRKRPDKLYASADRVIIGECDEKQHRNSNGSYSCEEERLSELYDEPSICGKPMAVIRWNPDTYKPPDGQSKAKRKERLSLYVYLHRKLSQSRSTWPRIAVYYMFYDLDNPHITKNLPYRLIYTKADIDEI